MQAFTRAVQQEPDNGDAWANIAAVHLQRRSWAPAFCAAAEAPPPPPPPPNPRLWPPLSPIIPSTCPLRGAHTTLSNI